MEYCSRAKEGMKTEKGVMTANFAEGIGVLIFIDDDVYVCVLGQVRQEEWSCVGSIVGVV